MRLLRLVFSHYMFYFQFIHTIVYTAEYIPFIRFLIFIVFFVARICCVDYLHRRAFPNLENFLI